MVGVFVVFDYDKLHDQGRANAGARAAYMWNTLNQNPVVGIRLLSSFPLSNATLIDPLRYRYADSAMTEDMKSRILNGGIVQQASDHSGDWAVAVASGPIELCPGLTRRVAFAIAAGTDSLVFLANCDSAQNWYDRFVGLEERTPSQDLGLQNTGCRLQIVPNPASGPLRIAYETRGPGPVSVAVLDVTGRKVATLLEAQAASSGRKGNVLWHPRNLSPGVYFVKLDAGALKSVAKLLVLD